MSELKRVTKEECIVNVLSLWYQIPVSKILRISQNIKRNGQYTPTEQGENVKMKLEDLKTNYQKGERPEIRITFAEGEGTKPGAVTLIYRTEKDFPMLLKEADKMISAWK